MSTASTSSTKKDQRFCCLPKQFFSKVSNITESLSIIPRVIIIKGNLRLHQVYRQNVSVTNTGLYPRRLVYSTNCPRDTEIKVYGTVRYRYINAGQNIILEITIKPRTPQDLTNDRHIYIESEHPHVIFDIPLIYVPKKGQKEDVKPTLPDQITFPRSLPKTRSFYELVVYNPTSAAATVQFKSVNKRLEAKVDPAKVGPRDFAKILLTLSVKDMTHTVDFFKVKFGERIYLHVNYLHIPTATTLYISQNYIQFEETKYDRECRKYFLICNESDNPIHYKLSFLTETAKVKSSVLRRKDHQLFDVSMMSLNKSSSLVSENIEVTNLGTEEGYNDQAHRHFRVNRMTGIINPQNSERLSVFFRPTMDPICDFDDELNPPFLAMTKILVETESDEDETTKYVVLSGLISGVEVNIAPKIIDFRRVYLGEEHCEQIFVTNTDGMVNSKVFLKSFMDKNLGVVSVNPSEPLDIEPCERKILKLSFYARVLGKVALKVVFKVRNGPQVNVIVKASVQQVKVKAHPELIEFGNVPVAVPQKRTVLIMNPLSVAISLKFTVPDDGSETPLILNVENVGDLPPITMRNPFDDLMEVRKELYSNQSHHDSALDEVPEIVTVDESIVESFKSFNISENTSYSSKFEDEVLDPISDIADSLIYHVKQRRYIEKPDAELNIISEATYALLDIPYFERLIRYTNYAFIDWNALPSDPQEIFIGNEVIHLKPNTVKNVTVLLIPNTLGYFNRPINIRCFPHTDNLEEDDPMRAIVNTKLMVSKIYIEYDCRMPNISWNKEVHFGNGQTIYIYEKYEFEMSFENLSNIGGFFHYAVVPDSQVAIMNFTQNAWKFFIRPYQTIKVPCYIRFKKVGKVSVVGIVKFVGKTVGETFHISANVLPTKIRFSPSKIYHQKRVLEKTWVYIFVDNITPTATTFILRLKHETKHYDLVPRGARLAPTGQGVCIGIRTMFPDPNIYKNVLYIDMIYGEVKEIPIIFNIIGVPIFFDPDIRNGFNAGIMLANCQKNLQGGYTEYSRVIRTWNRGERTYIITFRKLRNSKQICSIEETKGTLFLSPKVIELSPGAEDEIHINAVAYEETEVYNEFRVDITDAVTKKRMESIRVVVTATFMEAQLLWSRKMICMNYYRQHPFNEFPQIEIVKLINATILPIDLVHLKVFGPFKIKELFEHEYKQELMFAMEPEEKKEITVSLDKNMLLEDMNCKQLKGRIVCVANCKPQKTLFLYVNVTYPRVKIVKPEIVLFATTKESDITVELENISRVQAQFKWRKISEESVYISDVDDEMAYARDLISDIIRMLEIDENYEEIDSLCQQNLQQCYEKYHCYLKRLEDPIGIREMIYEIIDSIDYEHKRYHMTLTDDDDDDDNIKNNNKNNKTSNNNKNNYDDNSNANDNDNDDDDNRSSVVAAKTTLRQILDRLNLEDYYEISEPSTEDCFKERTVYFYEKSGQIGACEKCYVVLHLPGVRKGHMVKASFLFDVIGGEPQQFQVTLINLENVLKISRQSIYLGIKPWYELFTTRVSVDNVTKFTVDVKLEKSTKDIKKQHKLAGGYVNILGPRQFQIMEFGRKPIRMEGIMGFNEAFTRTILLTINDRETKEINLRGQGMMAMLGVTDSLPRQEQSQLDIEKEFRILQKIYYLERFKAFTEDEEDVEGEGEEGEDGRTKRGGLKTNRSKASSQSTSTDFSELSLETVEEGFIKHLKGYEIVEHFDVPNAIIIEQTLETEMFIQCVQENCYIGHLLQMIYCDYLKFLRIYDERLPMNLKYFTVQPLPFEQLGYIFKMDGLKMNQFRKFDINVHFYGPGVLIACARSAIKIPGLYVDFKVLEKPQEEIEFLYYNAERKSADLHKKPYRNMYERIMDLETDPRIKHPHAFDCPNLDCGLHGRDIRSISAQERRNLLNYYNSLNKSVHSDHKHHFVLCKIFSKSKYNFTDINMRVTILMKPTTDYYKLGQLLEDYLYIDLHMGPTLPILLRGLIR